MKIQLDGIGPDNVIQGYNLGRVTINSIDYRSSLIVTPDRIIENWPPARFNDLEESHFEVIAGLLPEVVVLGTGRHLQFPARAILKPLDLKQIGVEIMDTGAACRTYNILMAEGRRVAAALMMIQQE